ncbi:MAG: F0F1 ATP synthase subunit A [Clostridiales bacterium]|nr:F0F1 ATP synthase subunit A [Clostridiales bacterium]
MKLDLQAELSEQLELEEVFSFNIGSVKIGVDEATVVSWIIIAVLTVLAIILTRNLKVTGKLSVRQQILELCYEKVVDFFKGNLGEKGERYIPWLISVALYIGASNMIGLFGMKPPTKSIQVTAALALTSIVLIEFAAFKEKGFVGRLKAFAQPTPIVAPINILEIAIKPLSLCMRLFGNVIGAFIIMELIKSVVPVVLPIVLSLYFDLFDGFLQAYIFVFLTALYINEAIEDEDNPSSEKQTKKMKKASRKAKKAAKAA